MDYKQVFENNEQWVAQKLQEDEKFTQHLAAGQAPEFLFIGCSDSRVPPGKWMGTNPGDVFTHRNIGNVVCNTDANALTVIHYAVDVLEVDHIVIGGHYQCGGVKAAMQPAEPGPLNPWLNHIRDVYDLHRNELDNIQNEEKRYRRFVELNVLEQCKNMLKIPEVKQACNTGKTAVHGWVFDIGGGKIVDLEVDTEELVEELKGVY